RPSDDRLRERRPGLHRLPPHHQRGDYPRQADPRRGCRPACANGAGNGSTAAGNECRGGDDLSAQANMKVPAVKQLSLAICCLTLLGYSPLWAAKPVIHIDQPMSPPTWALLEREVLKTSAAACRAFYDHYFD